MKRTWIVLCLLAGCSEAPYVNTEQSSEAYVFGEDYEQYCNTLGAADATFITKAEQGYYYFDWSRLFYWDAKNKVAFPFVKDRNVNMMMKPVMLMQVMNISSYACNITVVGCI